jgi:transposase
LRRLFRVDDCVIEDIGFDDADEAVVTCRPTAAQQNRCGICQRRCPRYDRGTTRTWRHLDLGGRRTWLQSRPPRVRCPQHQVVVAAVPWARHGAGHTRDFDQTVAWLVRSTSKSVVCDFLRVGWRTVGDIMARVWADLDDPVLRLGSLTRIGIDEVSYKRGYKYLLVVVDHDTNRLVWAGEGRTKATLRSFFAELGPQACARISHVSADGADFITEIVAEYCPNAVRAVDRFHVAKWVNDALARVRVDAWQHARARARLEPPRSTGWAARHQARPATDLTKALKGSRFALWKNPENLTEKQQAKLDFIAAADPRLWRAYLLKERLRLIFSLDHADAIIALDRWLVWARRCRIPAFVELGQRIRRYRSQILAAIEHQISNGPIESVNNKIRVLTRMAYGFKNAPALIALAMFCLAIPKPPLPGRT